METVVIGNETRIELEFELEHGPDSERAYYSWIDVGVVIVAPPFGGQLQATLELDEVHHLRNELRRLLDDFGGTMQWESMEAWLTLDAKGDGRGHFELRCKVAKGLGDDTHLAFFTVVDQTEIGRTLRQLDRVCAGLDELFA